ncbi:hypothetical protein GEMRC1_003168 [Eukaryota sp. GEM-RC1]
MGPLRTKSTVKRLKMYRSRLKLDTHGKVVGGQFLSSTTSSDGRILPNRKWFGNTRVVGQNQLSQFREAIEATNSPYSVLLRQKKLPLSLVSDTTNSSGKAKILDIEPFDETFGHTRRRKKPRIEAETLEELASKANNQGQDFDDLEPEVEADKFIPEPIFDKGTSKRIWGELFRVVDSSDVIIQVLDARDPLGTRSRHLEQMLKRPEHKHRHLVLLINKVDLVPVSCTRQYVKLISQEYPCLAFKASVNKPFGKGALLNLLRQFAKLHHDKPQISVGLVGYPNTGKSSIINALKGKKCVNVAPIPGETKVWQFVTLMKRIYLIDCPGTIGLGSETPESSVLKGAIRTELIPDPVAIIPMILERVNHKVLRDSYNVGKFEDWEDFLKAVANNSGKLLKGGEPDLVIVSRMVLNDFLRGKVPWFIKPPNFDESLVKKKDDEVVVEQEINDELEEKDDVNELKEESEDDIDWDEVFDGEDDDDEPFEEPVVEEEEEDEESNSEEDSDGKEVVEEEEEVDRPKIQIIPLKTRMTTNKQKTGKHFYDKVDVKNRRKGSTKPPKKGRKV